MAYGWPDFEAEHPVRLLHPRTGEPVLFVTEHHAERILELDEGRSREVLDRLFETLYAPDARYEHLPIYNAALDLTVHNWLQDEGLTVQPVATKIDKLSRSAVSSALKALQTGLGISAETPILGYSSLMPAGRQELLARLVEAVDFDATDSV